MAFVLLAIAMTLSYLLFLAVLMRERFNATWIAWWLFVFLGIVLTLLLPTI